MANTVQIKRGNNASVSSYTGPSGEVIYNLDTNRLHSQDGSVAGGHPHALISDVNTKANSSVTIEAGAGLTGGGDLSANRTINVGAGTGLAVSADAVSLNAASITSLASADTAIQTIVAGTNITVTESGTSRTISAALSSQVNSDWNATSGVSQILNKPTLGTAAAQNVDAFATAAEGDLALTAVQPYDTVAVVAASTIPATVNAIRTNGYHAAGDGGAALYKRNAIEPTHAGKVQSADGAWWLLCSLRINVKMFGAKGDGVSNDTQAFKDAYQFFKTGTEEQGGTIHIPKGHYRLHDEWLFEGVGHVTNFWIEGDGSINTRLDFSSAPAGKSGIILRGSSSIGIKKLFITGAPVHGIVLNDNYDHFVSNVRLSELRIQGCGQNGIYSRNSYLITLEDIWAVSNGNDGVGFYGNHTSIIGNRVYASSNVGSGHRINGAVYIVYNGQSDSNGRFGYWLSNIRSATFNSLGSEENTRAGIIIQTGLHTDDIFPEYQGFQGVVFNTAFNLRNTTNGVYANSFVAEAGGGVPIRFTVIGCEEDVVSGRASWTLDASAGAIEVTQIDTVLKSNIVTGGTPKIKNFDTLFP